MRYGGAASKERREEATMPGDPGPVVVAFPNARSYPVVVADQEGLDENTDEKSVADAYDLGTESMAI